MEEQILTKDSEVMADAFTALRNAEKQLAELSSTYRPTMHGERLLTDAEVADILKITRRTLQEYRREHIIAYIELKGKILYKESDIQTLLSRNYHKAF